MCVTSEDTLEEPCETQKEPATFQVPEAAAPPPFAHDSSLPLRVYPQIPRLIFKNYCQMQMTWSTGGHSEMPGDIFGRLRLGWEYYKPNTWPCTGQPPPLHISSAEGTRLESVNQSGPVPVWSHRNMQVLRVSGPLPSSEFI